MEENLKRIYHAAMMDLHTAVEPDLDQIWTPDAGLRIAHGCQIGAPARTQSVLGFPPRAPRGAFCLGRSFLLIIRVFWGAGRAERLAEGADFPDFRALSLCWAAPAPVFLATTGVSRL